MSSMTRLFTRSAMRRTYPPGTRIASVRRSRLSTTAARHAYKDDQDKDSLSPRSTEYSKSGSDSEVAETDEAFDPQKTSPESQLQAQEDDGGSENPLEVSPGNSDSSKGSKSGGASSAPGESERGRDRTSGAGSGKKAGGGESGGG